MAKADESLAVARDLLKQEHYDFSASRAYYAMFYSAEAALLLRDVQLSKHSAVISHFNREFVKSGLLDPQMFKALQNGFALRNQGDYGVLPLEPDEARHLVSQAETFLAAVRGLLQREGHGAGGATK
jgi:uncharacterized protein (UPF0332 family)